MPIIRINSDVVSRFPEALSDLDIDMFAVISRNAVVDVIDDPADGKEILRDLEQESSDLWEGLQFGEHEGTGDDEDISDEEDPFRGMVNFGNDGNSALDATDGSEWNEETPW